MAVLCLAMSFLKVYSLLSCHKRIYTKHTQEDQGEAASGFRGPGPCTLDLDDADDDEVNDTLHDPSSALQATPPSPTRVFLIDSDSECDTLDDSSIYNPLTPRLRPRDPHFGFSEDALLRPIDIRACRIYQREEAPKAHEVLDLFLMMPLSYLRRQTDTETGLSVKYILSGASPRSHRRHLESLFRMSVFYVGPANHRSVSQVFHLRD